MDGIENDVKAGEPIESGAEKSATIPLSLSEAVSAAENSEFIAKNVPAKLLSYVLSKKKIMCEEFEQADDKALYDEKKYFYTL
jgi:glutamine synthetase